MQFNSITFAVFFLVVLCLHYSITSWKINKINLILASYLFYAAWNPPFVLLIIFSTAVDWILAGRIERENRDIARRFYLIISLSVNLGLLFYFKYANFLLDSFLLALEGVGISYSPPRYEIILPIGISFYTFQTLSYTIDVYRRKIRADATFLDFALFVTFFPQLVAGPIVRASHFLPQCIKEKKITSNQLFWGLTLITIGIFQKTVLADRVLAPIVDTVYANAVSVGSFEGWMAIFAFSGQIFFDFSGYSTCAIGIALCLGFSLPVNFRSPYAAIGFSDFWQRWHVSLSSWIRDYLYISLGGSRKGSIRTFVNLMITMLIGGLWHGASWLFVMWGGLHGIYLVLEHLIIILFKRLQTQFSSFVHLFNGMLTFIIVSITWVFFRSPDLATAGAMFKSLSAVGKAKLISPNQVIEYAVVMTGLILWHIITRKKSSEEIFNAIPWLLKSVVIGAMIVLIVYETGGDERAFIYFQF